MEKLLSLYKDWAGCEAYRAEKLNSAGSNRTYFRLYKNLHESVIGVLGESVDENNAFIYLSDHFAKCHLSVPRVLYVSADRLRYLQTDLGNLSLWSALSTGRNAGGCYTLAEKELLVRTINKLPEMQICGAIGLDFNKCYPQSKFDCRTIMFDLNYFKYCFLKPSGIDFNELRLEESFNLFTKELLSAPAKWFLYRDFQSRNIMLDSSWNPYFIDFQGGRQGPYYYDLASFLWQASAKYPHNLRRELIHKYYLSLSCYVDVPPIRHFAWHLAQFVLLRTLQVLGAYGFRGYYEGKEHFIKSIPNAIINLKELLLLDLFPYPYLMETLRRLVSLSCFNEEKTGRIPANDLDKEANLVVKIYSFSYKKGIPDDKEGHGGGYVFDCRCLPNPGKYAQYSEMTGIDRPVIRFLETQNEVSSYLNNVFLLAERHVKKYVERGFSSLTFAFGCTGGRHRSVYCAHRLAEFIHQNFGIHVIITHLEQGFSEEFAHK